ncbi:copper uptake system-associated protein [Bradyrhizobium sp. CCGB20]|uniref:copper uptake system-associated protein n=1 Tax=Bradyrhizobium sp. CCGB20 TaxID=2949633 RepID=UPI0020B2C9ED|nr:copper uptake system-associated protein [Bradyrhizobium sp. CCGB20]MCP3400194.1 copper uptake system-associated protein [Bradyrhizobium sp. CCGB20]
MVSTRDRRRISVFFSGRELITASLRALSLVFVLLASAAVPATEAGAEAEIEGLLHGMFDKPDAVLNVSPIVVAGGFAIADWTQGEMGGRALLHRKQASWVITLCAGDGIRSREALRHAGVPQQEAISLERNLAAAESKADPQRVAMFSRFEGMVTMDSPSNQPHGNSHPPK